MDDGARSDPPSPFVLRWLDALVRILPEPLRALDVAVGQGRHALPMAAAGFRVFGVDISCDRVRQAVEMATGEGLLVRGWCADLTAYPLPRERFELVVVTRYLQRDLFASIRDALVPGGVVIYETFTIDRRKIGRPTSPDHLLQRGELRSHFVSFEEMFHEEVSAPETVARIVARKAGG
jgi:tellurite methyltransferase